MARKLMTTRTSPRATSFWTGWGTIDGLHTAAPSTVSSCVKYAPTRCRCGYRESGRIVDAVRHEREVLLEGGEEVGVAISEARHHVGQCDSGLVLIEQEHTVDHRSGSGLAVDETFLARDEQPGQDSPRIGPDAVAAPPNLDPLEGGHARTSSRACCSVATMAKVDSAPWFSLRPSSWRPSHPPPVAGS